MTVMIDDSAYKQLREESWRRKLTPAEDAALKGWLATHPETQADWDFEAGLNEALARLPEAPLPSNFTSQVLEAVERDAAAQIRSSAKESFWTRLRWLPRIAFAGLVLCAAMLSYQQIQARQNRERVRAVVAVADVGSLPRPEVLRDFTAIQALSQTPADEELLTALK